LLDTHLPDAELRIKLFEKIPRTTLTQALEGVNALIRPADNVYYEELDAKYKTVRCFLPALAACRTTRRQSRRVSPCGTKSRISLVFWRFQGISPHSPYCGRNTAKRFKFQARQTSVHSPVTFFKPRREKRRKPITDLMIPKTGSIVCLRKA